MPDHLRGGKAGGSGEPGGYQGRKLVETRRGGPVDLTMEFFCLNLGHVEGWDLIPRFMCMQYLFACIFLVSWPISGPIVPDKSPCLAA